MADLAVVNVRFFLLTAVSPFPALLIGHAISIALGRHATIRFYLTRPLGSHRFIPKAITHFTRQAISLSLSLAHRSCVLPKRRNLKERDFHAALNIILQRTIDNVPKMPHTHRTHKHTYMKTVHE